MTTASICFEVECDVEGDVSPYRPGGREDPPEDACVENTEVISLGYCHRVNGFWRTTSLLEGVDVSSPDIRRLFENILAVYQDEADLALLTAAEGDAE